MSFFQFMAGTGVAIVVGVLVPMLSNLLPVCAGVPGINKESAERKCTLPELKIGQGLSPVSATIKEGKTSPPRHFTEDSLLAAMETAGAADMPEDAERKGWEPQPPALGFWKS